MYYWIIPVSDLPIARSTVRPISIYDQATTAVVGELASYDFKITEFFAIKNKQYPIFNMDTPG